MNPLELDPGIRGIVMWLRINGFETTDSGDGVSKVQMIASGDALAFPNVFMRCSSERMRSEADRLLALVCMAGFGDKARIEASYDPRDRSAVLGLYNVSDNDAVPRGGPVQRSGLASVPQ